VSRVIYKNYSVCSGDIEVSQSFDASIADYNTLTVNGVWTAPDTYSSTPDWFTPYNNGFGSYDSFYFLPSDVPTGTFPISFSGTDGNEYLVVINKTAECGDISYSNKCCDSINIMWLNKYGGRENYIFGGIRKVFDINEGEDATFKTQELVLKNSKLSNVYKGVIANTGKIPKSHLIKLESLKTSIQAWVYDETLPAYYEFADRFYPIILDRESMILNDTKEKIIERSVRFRVAKEVNIQSQ